ncbi:hypothetical protein [Cohnella sp. WQ 127256]|uniref:hypothetical protein n=1 Tax=Cohnella sp. WQ 127256 TaxID=2938790 RepID=UPI002117DD68|nr:hypothetical protein [Cohnella sp. WQ 127256]
MKKFVNINDAIDSFLKSINNDREKDRTYKSRVLSFMDYLIDEKDVDIRNDIYTDLESLSHLDIKQSMKYYISTSRLNPRKVNTIEALKLYVSVVQSFILFLADNGVPNDKLIAKFSLSETDKSSITSIIEEVSVEEKLREKMGKNPLTEEEQKRLKKLIAKCFNNSLGPKILEGKRLSGYRSYLSSIIINIILETGVKYKVIKTITTDNINFETRTLLLHDKYSIPLSEELLVQLKRYLEIRDEVVSRRNINSNTLFIHPTDRSNPGINIYVTEFLRRIGRTDTIGISKTKIIDFMVIGVPEILIKDITKFDKDVLSDCKKLVDYKEENSFINEYLIKNF